MGIACRSDLCNSLLSGTIYLAQQQATSTQQMQDLVSSCLDSFLTGDIHTAYAQSTAGLDMREGADLKLQPASASVADAGSAAVTAGDDTSSDSSSQASGITADGDVIDDYLRSPSMHRNWQPLTLVVGVAALPKGALVEVQPEACTVEAMTHLESSDGSSDDEEGGRSLAEHEQTSKSNWAGRLLNQEGTLQGANRGYYTSLASQRMYLCCQVVFNVEVGSVGHNMECIVGIFSDRLAEAGMTAQHVIQCTVYSHTSTYALADNLLSCFQEHWLQKHVSALPVLHVPAWLLITAVGAKMQLLPECFACMKLTAHQV